MEQLLTAIYGDICSGFSLLIRMQCTELQPGLGRQCAGGFLLRNETEVSDPLCSLTSLPELSIEAAA